MLQNTQQFWKEAWSRHFDSYARNWGRQAYYLRFILAPHERRLLELGAGSFRDTVRLNQWGYDCLGADFSQEAVERARRWYPRFANKIHCMDASQLELQDKCVDVSFHNGFFILLDNHSLDQVLSEQIRVTRRRIVCTVHNALHQQQVDNFNKLKETDQIYDIRFFTPDEIKERLAPHCSRVALYPFGDRMLDRSIRYFNRVAPLGLMYRRVMQRDVRNSERIMAVGELN